MIQTNEIYSLRDQGFQVPEIARRLNASGRTVKHHLRKRKNADALRFANQLQALIAEAPNEICKAAVSACVDRIRKGRAAQYALLYPVFLRLAEDGCRFWFEFQDETGLSERNARGVLREMVAAGLLRVNQESGNQPKQYLQI